MASRLFCVVLVLMTYASSRTVSESQTSENPNLQALNGHLAAIHKLDDQQCIPRLICELASTKDRKQLAPQEKSVLSLFSQSLLGPAKEGTPQADYQLAARIGLQSQNRSSSACPVKYHTCPLSREQLVSVFNLMSASANAAEKKSGLN